MLNESAVQAESQRIDLEKANIPYAYAKPNKALQTLINHSRRNEINGHRGASAAGKRGETRVRLLKCSLPTPPLNFTMFLNQANQSIACCIRDSNGETFILILREAPQINPNLRDFG
ncbi:hypothetical protein SUGI_0226210 [Cryptomeria japonica]|nr:hypothetical protein SUGI_0226210 [Cryptomeria japonica]